MPEIEVTIGVAGEAFPHPDEMEMRWDLEETITEQIGAVRDGSGPLDLIVTVENPAAALPTLDKLLRQFGVQQFTLTVREDA